MLVALKLDNEIEFTFDSIIGVIGDELQTVRNDIDTIINTSEFASILTLVKTEKTMDDSGNLLDLTEDNTKITAILQPTGARNIEINEYGEPIIGKKKAFFKYQYIDSNGKPIFPQIDDKIIDVFGYRWRVTELNPWIVGNGVGYYEGTITRDDLDN